MSHLSPAYELVARTTQHELLLKIGDFVVVLVAVRVRVSLMPSCELLSAGGPTRFVSLSSFVSHSPSAVAFATCQRPVLPHQPPHTGPLATTAQACGRCGDAGEPASGSGHTAGPLAAVPRHLGSKRPPLTISRTILVWIGDAAKRSRPQACPLHYLPVRRCPISHMRQMARLHMAQLQPVQCDFCAHAPHAQPPPWPVQSAHWQPTPWACEHAPHPQPVA